MYLRNRPLPIVLFVCLAALLGVSGCSLREGPPNILLITVDTLRPDHLGLYGYERPTSPNIDEFFEDTIVFEYAYATEANTTPSVVSFLSGTLPQENGVRLLCQKVPEDLTLISDRLSQAGYQTAGIVSNVVLTVECSDLDRHFDYYDDYVDDLATANVYERIAGPTTNAAAEWAVTKYDREQPYFLWVHYQDPHGPYSPPPDKPVDFTHEGKKRFAIGRVEPYQRVSGGDDALEYIDNYDEEIAYLDQEVGRLLALLEEKEMLDNTVVIFTSDHGESMMEHEKWFTHGYHVYDEILRVPLMIRYPGRNRGARVPKRVSLVDLAPTVLDLTGVELETPMRGQVLGRTVEERPVYGQGGLWRSMIYGDQKWFLYVPKESPRPVPRFFYDLNADPGERARKHWIDSDLADDFVKMIASDPDPGGVPAEFEMGMMPTAPKVRPDVDEETLKKLRSLGYVN